MDDLDIILFLREKVDPVSWKLGLPSSGYENSRLLETGCDPNNSCGGMVGSPGAAPGKKDKSPMEKRLLHCVTLSVLRSVGAMLQSATRLAC